MCALLRACLLWALFALVALQPLTPESSYQQRPHQYLQRSLLRDGKFAFLPSSQRCLTVAARYAAPGSPFPAPSAPNEHLPTIPEGALMLMAVTAVQLSTIVSIARPCSPDTPRFVALRARCLSASLKDPPA
jgi:hypothetical protein